MTRAEQAQKSKQHIIDSTINVIEEKGYQAVTIKDICEQAEISVGAFYHYFNSISDVIFTFYIQFDEEIAQGFNHRTFHDWKEMIAYLLEAYLQLTLRNGWKISAAIITTQLSIEEKYLFHENRFFNQSLIAAVNEGKQCGDISSSEKSEDICLWLLRSIRGSIFDWVMHAGQTDLLGLGIHDYENILTRIQFA